MPSSNDGSWSGSGRRANASTQAGRATNRCRSTCGSSCGGAFHCCATSFAGWCRRSPIRPRPAGRRSCRRTHVRRAQPVLAAHYFLAHAAALRRDVARLETASADADAMPLGSGAIAGTNYAVDTTALAAELGFSRVVVNSLDASSDRDFVSSFLHASALTMVHLSRLAEDLVFFTGEEFGYFDLPDRFATGSSLMPQKKNPDPLELVRGKTGRVVGALAGWLTTMKGLPSGYNRDLQEDKEAAFDAEATLAGSLAATTSVVAGLRFAADRAAAAASGLLLATDVADYLVARGVPFREAHATVGAMVRELAATGRDFSHLTPQEWARFAPAFGEDAGWTITARASVGAKRTPQSTSPDAVRQALAELRAWLGAQGPGPGPRDQEPHPDVALRPGACYHPLSYPTTSCVGHSWLVQSSPRTPRAQAR